MDREEDRISELPDAVLRSIISRLTLREATATSILSPRWQSLYTHFYTRPHFPPFEPEPCPRARCYKEKIPIKMFSSYTGMIDHFVVSHKADDRIPEFRVRMPCMKGADIQRWVEFALSRKVETLEIIMRRASGIHLHRYSFRLSSRVPSCRVLVGLRCLKNLSLSLVDVDDETLETLLSNSRLLESLSIERCDTLTKVSIVGSPPFLKHLNISSCSRHLQSIEIRDMMELVSLRCYMNDSPPTARVVRLSNVPKLVELDTSDDHRSLLAQILPTIPPAILDQLQLLKLCSLHYSIYYTNTYVIPELVNVKHLELQVFLYRGEGSDTNSYAVLPMLEACPSLEELHIELFGGEDHKGFSYQPFLHTQRLSPKLKKLKLSRYSGTQTQLRFATNILGCIDALEELVVQPISTSNEMRRLAQHHFLTTVLRICQSSYHFNNKHLV